jgi:hypothetical protein
VGFGGSRIKGYWNDDSDYDVKVNKLPDSEQKAKIASHPWKCKVDISFCSPEHYEKENVIEIP